MVTSYSDNDKHSINLNLKETSFVSEDVSKSVIVNQGGRLKSANCMFENNTAESMITSERGTMDLRWAEFSGNKIVGGEGVVVLDAESELESSVDNCAAVNAAGGDTGPLSTLSGTDSGVEIPPSPGEGEHNKNILHL